MDGRYTSTTQTVRDGESAPVAIDANRRLISSPSSQAAITTATATIANGASLSDPVDLSAATLVAIQMPAAWTAATLTFQSSWDGVTFADKWDGLGNEYTLVVGASRFIEPVAPDFLGSRYIKIRSGSAAIPVAQGAARDLKLMAR